MRKILLLVLLLGLTRSASAGSDPEWTWLGPDGGATGPFVFSEQEPQSIFAASANGVFQSRDGGVSWLRSAAGLADPQVYSLVRTGPTLLAGTRRGAFRSRDEGASWEPVDLGVTDEWVLVLAVDPQQPARVFAGGAQAGVFRSENGGETWTPANGGLNNLSVAGLAVSPTDSNIVFVSVSTGVFRSEDGGWNWVDTALDRDVFPPGQIVVNQQGEPLVATYGGISRLRDGIWTNLLEPEPFISGPVSTIALHPSNPEEILVAASTVLARSRDDGATWESIPIGNLFNAQVRGLAYLPSAPDTILAGTNGGTFISADSGASWREALEGLRARFVSSLGLDSLNPLVLYAGAAGGAFKTVSRQDWVPIRGELDGLNSRTLALNSANPNLVFAGNSNGVYRSKDAGLHWDPILSGSVRALTSHPGIPGLLIAAVPAGLTIFGPPESILRSRDSGDSWELFDGRTAGLPSDAVIDRFDESRIFVSTSLGVYFSSEGGAWQEINEGLTDRAIASLEQSVDGALLAGTRSGRVFRRSVPGDIWTELSQPSTAAVLDFAVAPGHPDTIYAATEGAGLFLSSDRGTSWTPVAGLENPYVRHIQFSQDGRRLYAAGEGGVYEQVLETMDDLGVTIEQSVSGNPFPRGTVSLAVRMGRAAGPGVAGVKPYLYQQALPLGLRLLDVTSSRGSVFAGPAYNSITWFGDLETDVDIEIQAEVLDGAQGRRLVTQGWLLGVDEPDGAQSAGEPAVVDVQPSPVQGSVLAIPRTLPFANTFVGFALLNPTTSPSRVVLEGVEASGEVVQTAPFGVVVGPGAQLAKLTADFVSQGQTTLIRAPDSGLRGFFLLGDNRLERMDGVGGQPEDSQRLVMPRIQQDGQHQTLLYLFNPDETAAADLSLAVFDPRGEMEAAAQLVLPPHGSIWAPVLEIFPDLGVSDGYLTVEASRPVRGFQLVVSEQTFETLPALPRQSTDRLRAPHVFFGSAVGTTRLRLLNTGTRDLDVTIRMFDDQAGLLGDPVIRLETGELRTLDLEDLFGDGSGETRQGWLSVTAVSEDSRVMDWPFWLATVEYASADGSTASNLPLIANSVAAPVFLQVAQSSRARIFQGLAALDLGPVPPAPVPVQLDFAFLIAFNPSGLPTVFNLLFTAPRSRLSGLLNEPQLFGPGFEQEGGYLQLFSQRPTIAYTLFGGKRFLAAVEAQGSSLFLY